MVVKPDCSLPLTGIHISTFGIGEVDEGLQQTPYSVLPNNANSMAQNTVHDIQNCYLLMQYQLTPPINIAVEMGSKKYCSVE